MNSGLIFHELLLCGIKTKVGCHTFNRPTGTAHTVNVRYGANISCVSVTAFLPFYERFFAATRTGKLVHLK